MNNLVCLSLKIEELQQVRTRDHYQCDHYKEIGDEESYKASRNRTVEIIKQAKTEYYTNVIEKNISNSKCYGTT